MRANRALTRIAVALAVLSVPSLALALDLLSAGGFTFDLEEDHNGTLSDGEDDAYDTCYWLEVNGTTYDAGGTAPVVSADGRFVDMAPDTIDDLTVERHVYVPSSGGDYIRYLDVVTNPGATDATISVEIRGNLGSDTSTEITGSSSGDTTLTIDDAWFATDDSSDGSGDTSLAHVFQTAGAPVPASTAALTGDDDISWRFSTTVPAGGRVAFLTFAIQANDRATSIAEAERVAALPSDTLVGLSAYAADIVNVQFAGAPRVWLDAPDVVDEGAEITFDALVLDFDGGTATWSWDLDGDGTFGELPDAASYTVPAGTTDGEGELTIAVQASDGTDTRIATKTVHIANVAPEITSEPPTTASGLEYRYQVEVDEPGGALDPLTFRLGGARPPGMTISSDGLVTWVPPPEARGRTYTAVVRVLDGDLGQDVQTWDILVGENTPPDPPTPMSPLDFAQQPPDAPVTLVATNGADADGDPIAYFFQISDRSSFDGGGVIGSGELPEGDGTTSWTAPEPLPEGVWYWRVWVSDGSARSVDRFGSFLVGSPDIPMPDAGLQSTPDAGVDAGSMIPSSGGCSIAPSGSDRFCGIALALAAALWLVRRRGETNR